MNSFSSPSLTSESHLSTGRFVGNRFMAVNFGKQRNETLKAGKEIFNSKTILAFLGSSKLTK